MYPLTNPPTEAHQLSICDRGASRSADAVTAAAAAATADAEQRSDAKRPRKRREDCQIQPREDDAVDREGQLSICDRGASRSADAVTAAPLDLLAENSQEVVYVSAFAEAIAEWEAIVVARPWLATYSRYK